MSLKIVAVAIALGAAMAVPVPRADAQDNARHQQTEVRTGQRQAMVPVPGPGPQYLGASPRAPFSAAVHAGNVLYLSGVLGEDESGRIPPGIGAQTTAALQRIDKVLVEHGSSRAQVLQCLVILTDLDDFAGMNAAYTAFFPAGRLPARTTFEASGLLAGALIEIQCNAAVGN